MQSPLLPDLPSDPMPLMTTREAALWPQVADGSCHLDFWVQNRTDRVEYKLPLIELTHAHAWALHNHLGQYLVRQQVYDAEFRNPPA